jgi:hypothetical protein
MDTVTYPSRTLGLVPLYCPWHTIAWHRWEDEEKKELVFVFILKRKDQESTFQARTEAALELGVKREVLRTVSFYAAGFAAGGGVRSYEVLTMQYDSDGYLRVDLSRSTPPAGGNCTTEPEVLIEALLNIKIKEARQKSAKKKA